MDISNIILQAHRGFAYLGLLLVAVFLISLLIAMLGYSGNISKLLRKSTLFTMIFFHIQFLVGLGMLFVYSGFLPTIKSSGMGAVMKNSDLRFKYIEHPFSMLIVVVLFTILNKKLKTNDKLSLGIVALGLVALALFFYAFPFFRLFRA